MVSSNLVESYFVECSHVLHDCESSIKIYRVCAFWPTHACLARHRPNTVSAECCLSVCCLSGISELRLNGARQTYEYYRTLIFFFIVLFTEASVAEKKHKSNLTNKIK